MAEIRVAIERQLAAPADQVYQYIADYERHHGQWLPPEYSNYRAAAADTAGTSTVFYHLKTGTRERDYTMRITQPVPGRVVKEEDTNSSLEKTWTVTPSEGGSRVRIETRWDGARGVGGFFERLFAPRVLSALYAVELQRLDRYAYQQAS
ncbi:MAG: SRPBCC family protein [Chloroflexota bacterium]